MRPHRQIRTEVAPKGAFLFLENLMPEKISRFAILVRDMRAAQKPYFDTPDKTDLSRANF